MNTTNNDLIIRQLTSIDDDILDTITNWMYKWWGEKDGYTSEAVRCFMEHSLQKDRLPQTHGLFLKNDIIGMFQLTYEDLKVRPDIYPWLANVYIDKKYRGKGYGRMMLENLKDIAMKNLDFKELFLYTKHKGLYEKFGWQYVCEIDTFDEKSRIEGLYKLEIEKQKIAD